VRAFAITAVLVAAAPVRAERAVAVAADADTEIVARDVVLRRDAVLAAVSLESTLTVRQWGEPISFAPDVWVGATDDLTVGIIHSARAHSVVDAGFGMCVSGTAGHCPRAYDNVGLDARYRLRRGRLAAAARVRLALASFEPLKPSVRVGALLRARGRGSRFALVTDPHVQVGLANTDQGNRSWVRVPLWLAVQPLSRWAIALRTGIEGEVDTFDETFAIAVGLDTTVRINRRVDLSALIAFPSLLGPQNQYRSRAISLTLTARWP
jgi:hypothetical protein